MIQTTFHQVLHTAFIVLCTLQAQKTAIKNNWTFWDFVRNKKYQMLLADVHGIQTGALRAELMGMLTQAELSGLREGGQDISVPDNLMLTLAHNCKEIMTGFSTAQKQEINNYINAQ